jgi:uncharacterized protein
VTIEVFVDAAAWVAVVDRGDTHHEAAVACHLRLMNERRLLVTTNLVVTEAHALILRYGGYRTAINFLESVRSTLRLVKVFEDEALEVDAEATLRRFADQDFSLADAVSFSVMRQRGIEEAFTFDRHFSTAGFVIVPAV